MANTVSALSYANTFGEWVVVTNQLVNENNDFAANNYTKPSGTLYLNDSTLGLQIGNNAIVAGNLQVQGVGSSVYVQNNLRVGSQVYLTNTLLSLVASGQANIDGPVFATASGTGLTVANNTVIGGTLSVSRATSISNSISVTGSTTIGGNTTISNTVYISGNTTVSNDAIITGNTFIGNYANVVNEVISYGSYNTVSNTQQQVIRGNSAVWGTQYSNNIQANNSVNTTSMNAATSSVTGISFVRNLQANTNVNTAILSVSGNSFVNYVTANTQISSPKLVVSTVIDANSAVGYFSSIQTSGQVSVGGNFVINGSTVYNTNTFTLSASSSNQTSYINVFRSPGANASIRWNETSKIWDMLNVDNSTYFKILTSDLLSTSGALNSSSNVATSSALFTANVFLQANDATTLSTARTYTDNANTWLQANTGAGIIQANTSLKQYTDFTLTTANTNNILYTNANITANLNTALANTGGANIFLQSAISTANSSLKNYVDANLANVISTTNSNITANLNLAYANTGAANIFLQSAISTANSSLKNYVDANLSLRATSANSYTDTTVTTANTNLKAYVDGTVTNNYTTAISTANTSLKSYADGTFPTRTGTGASGSWAISITGSSATAALAGKSAELIVNYNNDTNASYQLLWGSANTVYGTAGVTLNPSTDYVTANSFVASTWFRSTGSTGWQNTDYGGGIFMQDTTFIRTFGSKAFYCDQAIYSANNIVAYYSDERLKTKLGNISGALDSVCKLDGFRYIANDKAKELGYTDGKVQLGVGAGQVEAIFPEIVTLAPVDISVDENGNVISKTGENYRTVDYARLVPVLIEAIKELKAEVDYLKNK